MYSRLLTTGIGSLPFKDGETAVKYVGEHYSLRFFPQLVPMLDETEPKGMTPDQVVDRQAATAPFLASLNGVDPVKIQLAGPLTLQKTAGDGVERWDWVETMTRTWVTRLREVTEGPIYFFWDDALLAAEGTEEDLARVQAFRDSLAVDRVRLGVHCCAPLTLAQLTTSLPGLTLALDAHVVDLVSPEAVHAARAHAEKGGDFLLGIVDTRKTTVDADAATKLLNRIHGAWGDVFDDVVLGVSGGCGTALHTEAFERALSAALTRCVTSTQ